MDEGTWYAAVRNGVVTVKMRCVEGFTDQIHGAEFIPIDGIQETVEEGYSYVDGVFTAPPVPEEPAP